jgi:ribosomal protein S18 acetylase RimI-like enzyme
VQVREADLSRAADADGLLEVLESYARSPAGGGAPLAPDVRLRLIPALREQDNALLLLGLVDARVVGIATCFYGFSTFAARPLLNVHDLAVLPSHQRRGIGRALLASAEARARARGCAKLTLEVLETNHDARRLYESCGFSDFELAGTPLRTHFLSKALKP